MQKLFQAANFVIFILSIILAIALIYAIITKGIALIPVTALLLDVALGARSALEFMGGKN